MRAPGQPETVEEATSIINDLQATPFHIRRPAHYPDAQILALGLLVTELQDRIAKLEAKPKRGRPPKAATE